MVPVKILIGHLYTGICKDFLDSGRTWGEWADKWYL